MAWVAVGAAAVSAIGGAYAANKSAKAQKHAGNQANAAAEQNYQRNLANYQPYLDLGTTGTTGLTALANGDYSGFMKAPDYLATQQSGLQALDRSAAARGALNSGGADADRIAFGANLGAQQLGQYRGFLTNLAGMGQNAAGGIANSLNGVATTATNAAYNNADATGSAAAGTAGAASGFLNTLLGQYGGSKTPAGTSAYAPAQNWGAFQPTQHGWNSGGLGPSNGSSWNFGGG